MPVTHSEHTLRQHPCGFLRGNCAVLQDSAVPDTPQTCSESLSVVCGFCPECYGIYEHSKDENGNSFKLFRKGKAYIDLAAEHMLSSPETAFQIVNGAYEKMLIELAIDEYIHIVELRLKSTDNNSVTYEYCADHNNDWGKIHYTFGEDDYDVVRYIYADRKGDFFFATAGEWIMHNTGRKHIPRYMVVSL